MMTISTRDYFQRLRHFNKKQSNNVVKTETIGSTAEVTRFDRWFASSYTRLREKIHFFSMVDEDNLHNTYLFIKEKIMGGEEKIENLEAYFFRCYRYKVMTEMRNGNRYVHPEDDFFCRFSQEETESYPRGLNRCERLAGDVLRYIRSRLSRQEHRMFMLRYYRQQCSLKVPSEYTGLPLFEVVRKTRRMLESLRSNSYFMERCGMLYVYE